VTGTGGSALFQLYNPWGTNQPPAITWAQLTQAGDFTQDGDTVVGTAAATGLQNGAAANAATSPILGTTASPDDDSGSDTPDPISGQDLVVRSLRLAAGVKRGVAVPHGPRAPGIS